MFNTERIDLLLYAGILHSPFSDSEIRNIQCPFTGEFGNNDGDRLFLLNHFQKIGPIYPEPYETNVDVKNIIMFHKNDIIADLWKSGEIDLKQWFQKADIFRKYLI